MKKIGKIGRYLFSVLPLALLLTGCGQNGSEKNDETAETLKSEIPTLIWWIVGDKPADYEAGMENMNVYLEEKLGLHLDLRFVEWAEWEETTNSIINNREYFDLMFVDVTSFNQFASMGALQDVTDLIYKYTPDLWQVMPEAVWSGARQAGRIYAVPAYKDSALCQYWVFDDFYLQKYHVSPEDLNTWEDLGSYFTTLKEGEGEDFYPLLLSKGANMNVFSEYDSFTCGLQMIGVRPDDPERRVVCLLEEESVLEKLNYLRQWYLQGLINPDANVTGTLSAPRPFFLGIGWPGAEAVWQQTEGIEKVVIKKSFGPVYSRDSIQGSMNAISAQSDYKKEALMLLELINTDHRLRDMMAYGVEGRNFEYVSENVVRQLNNDWTVNAYTQGTFFNMSTLEEQPEDVWEQLKQNNERAEKSVLLDFEMDLRELGVELAACKKIWKEYASDLTTGAVEPEPAIAECLQKMRENGLDIIISEAQKQIDAQYGKTGR